ncbi:MAG TPA: carbohydrate ABC transporter permease [Solirubrobacteraceae bacterium]|jgi:multiple sugar transport system permease protein|nr:carbohydrate ABC transporter permease [Solirubrobacteraceae bacterium]
MSVVGATDATLPTTPESAPRVPHPPRTPRRTGNILLALVGVLFALPMLWMLTASLDSQASWSIEWPHFTLANFRAATGSGQLHSLWNSFVLSAIATIVSTAASSLAAYALSRRRIPWKGPILLIVLFLSGVPMSILIVPIYQMFATENWLSILPTAIFLGVTAMPFEIWLIKNFMDAIPYELEEAARIEHASTWQILTRIVGPLALPGIGAGAIYSFVNAWGSFVVPLVLITDPNQQPGPIAIYGFIGAANVRYGDIAAFSLLYSVPVFILYAIMSRLFAGGFTLGGAIKG